VTRTQINQANAQHSTGPKTEAGRRRSCLNALRHGLTGQIIVLPADDMQAYRRHVQSFTSEYRPQGATESHLVQSLADTAWRQNRVFALETNLLTHDIIYDDFPNHESTHDMREAIAIAAALDRHTRALSTLSLHGQRLARQFEKTLALLKQLQSTRLANQGDQLNQPANLVQMHRMEEEPSDPGSDPGKDGFVFSDKYVEALLADLAHDDRDQRASGAEDYCLGAA
jgi:hypothetical protein